MKLIDAKKIIREENGFRNIICGTSRLIDENKILR